MTAVWAGGRRRVDETGAGRLPGHRLSGEGGADAIHLLVKHDGVDSGVVDAGGGVVFWVGKVWRRGVFWAVSALLEWVMMELMCFCLQDNWTALHFAAKEGHVACVRELLEAGANTEAKDMVSVLRECSVVSASSGRL